MPPVKLDREGWQCVDILADITVSKGAKKIEEFLKDAIHYKKTYEERKIMKISLLVVSLAAVGTMLAASGEEDKLPFLRPGETKEVPKAENEYVILMNGNSITRHGVNPDVIKKLGWTTTCGMAASSEEKDYAHLLAAKIQATMPKKKVRLVFGDKEKRIVPDLIVLQGGEHVTASMLPKFEEQENRRFAELRKTYPKAKIISIGIWNPRCREEFKTCTGPTYAENAPAVEKIQRKVAEKFGIPFASVSKYENDPANTGSGKVAAVRWHPNDNGMKRYAEEAFNAYLKTQE